MSEEVIVGAEEIITPATEVNEVVTPAEDTVISSEEIVMPVDIEEAAVLAEEVTTESIVDVATDTVSA